MSATTAPPLFEERQLNTSQPRGRIGSRQLTVTQTFQIGRLTSHPIQLVPGTFIAVHGRGPRRDSNGSGKTTWLAAVSLLLGDPQWRLTSGRAAADLLFSPTAAGLRTSDYPAPTHGYIVGVFTRFGHTPITIWMRINATSPFLQVKTTDGIHLASGDNDTTRHRRADEIWKDLGSDSAAWGSSSFSRTLYGDTPRCLAWVQKRGKLNPGPSLLHTAAGEFQPEQIGQALIDLTGHTDLLTGDVEARRALASNSAALDQARRADEEATVREERELTQVQARRSARMLLAEATDARRSYDAVRLTEVLTRAAEISDDELPTARGEQAEASKAARARREKIAELERQRDRADDTEEADQAYNDADSELTTANAAKQTLETAKLELETERGDLADLAATAPQLSSTQLRAELTQAQGDRDEARAEVLLRRRELQSARNDLDAIEAGGATGRCGELLARLRAEGIDAVRLLDAVELDDADRSVWEARLHPLTDAVVVSEGHRDDALAAARSLPGAIVVSGPDGALPTGVVDAPSAAATLLQRLATDLPVYEPGQVGNVPVGVYMTGGFEPTITGRHAAVDAARARYDEQSERLNEALQAERDADDAVTTATKRLEAAQAAERLTVIAKKLPDLVTEIEAATVRVRAATTKRQKAHDQLVAVQAAVQSLQARVDALKLEEQTLSARATETEKKIDELQRQLRDLRLDYWRERWDGTDAEAAAIKAAETRSGRRLKNLANTKLSDALRALDIDGPDDAPTAEIRSAVRARTGAVDDPDDDAHSDSTFDSLVAALDDWLATTLESDDIAAETITTNRQRRSDELELTGREVEAASEQLELVQDAIEEAIERSLRGISAKLDELNRAAGGIGAELHVACERPAAAEETWRWAVTPRWRRHVDGDMVSYREQINTAAEKLFTIQLVLAALLSSAATSEATGQVLILDELGDSFGQQHRRDVLAALQQAAAEHDITILGTCQDSVLEEAARVCGEILYFVHETDSHVLNQPTRMYGLDADRERQEIAVEIATVGRPVV